MEIEQVQMSRPIILSQKQISENEPIIRFLKFPLNWIITLVIADASNRFYSLLHFLLYQNLIFLTIIF